ncbi:uncharacterized protein LOC112048061 [Bicyclus anynana]|uniref:Uncharacterized protein LOC112048061 n=1 Tax=Bicyclus anynana TaxID=110368 RepID=A0A6J1N026_BICAN|nr:uncharacterized protein LOC112048061 [Bicyclus anynana]
MITSHDFPVSHAFPYKMQVQSHAILNVGVETGDMRRNSFYLLITVALCLFFTLSFGYQITFEDSKASDANDILSREKRQLEDLDNEYPTLSAQEAEEEPGFWDRVVKVALKLFNKFIEWLNSS